MVLYRRLRRRWLARYADERAGGRGGKALLSEWRGGEKANGKGGKD